MKAKVQVASLFSSSVQEQKSPALRHLSFNRLRLHYFLLHSGGLNVCFRIRDCRQPRRYMFSRRFFPNLPKSRPQLSLLDKWKFGNRVGKWDFFSSSYIPRNLFSSAGTRETIFNIRSTCKALDRPQIFLCFHYIQYITLCSAGEVSTEVCGPSHVMNIPSCNVRQCFEGRLLKSLKPLTLTYLGYSNPSKRPWEVFTSIAHIQIFISTYLPQRWQPKALVNEFPVRTSLIGGKIKKMRRRNRTSTSLALINQT
ncbi:hypothetical protein SDJN02_21208, partial [Cucurbita argyrosperma subsp. argyrosperma]